MIVMLLSVVWGRIQERTRNLEHLVHKTWPRTCVRSVFKFYKKQTKSENHETCWDVVILYVEAMIKILEDFVHVVTYDAYNVGPPLPPRRVLPSVPTPARPRPRAARRPLRPRRPAPAPAPRAALRGRARQPPGRASHRIASRRSPLEDLRAAHRRIDLLKVHESQGLSLLSSRSLLIRHPFPLLSQAEAVMNAGGLRRCVESVEEKEAVAAACADLSDKSSKECRLTSGTSSAPWSPATTSPGWTTMTSAHA